MGSLMRCRSTTLDLAMIFCVFFAEVAEVSFLGQKWSTISSDTSDRFSLETREDGCPPHAIMAARVSPRPWRELVKLPANVAVFENIMKHVGIDPDEGRTSPIVDDTRDRTSASLDNCLLTAFWKYLLLLFETPRPSTNYKLPEDPKRLDRVRALLKELAADLGVEYRTDRVGNVLLFKKSTLENTDSAKAGAICLQGHLDIVCSKNATSQHNFDTDPLETVLADEDGKKWVKSALASTLGADNGVGIAAGLAFMEVLDGSQHADLELLCTVNEETDFSGAEKIGQPDPKTFLRCQQLLNLDSEDADAVCIGCAGGFEHAYFIENLVYEDSENGFCGMLDVELSGFHGGHSGGDIHTGYANAILVLLRLLRAVLALGDRVSLVQMKGGTGPTAIAREASCCLAFFTRPDVAAGEVLTRARAVLDSQWAEVKQEFCEVAKTEDVVKLQMLLTTSSFPTSSVSSGATVGSSFGAGAAAPVFKLPPLTGGTASAPRRRRWLTDTSTRRLVRFLSTLPHGVLAFARDTSSDKVGGSTSPPVYLKDLHGQPLVESSINFGMLLFHESVTRENAASRFAAMTDNAITGPKRFCWRCQRFEALGTIKGGSGVDHVEEPLYCQEVDEVLAQEEQSSSGVSATCYAYLFFRSSDNAECARYGQEELRGRLIEKFEADISSGVEQDGDDEQPPTVAFDSDLCPFPAWQPRWDSPFLQKIVEAYRKTALGTTKEPLLYTCHGGLECGAFLETYPDLDCVSIGPQIEYPHSPDERVAVDSCAEWLRWLRAALVVDR